MDIKESTTVTYSEDRGRRYLLTKKWSDDLPKATIIMLMPSGSGVVQQDVTIGCIINCISQLGFGSVDIVNLFSRVDVEISANMKVTGLTDKENDKIILESVATSTTVILAWGKCDETNIKIKQRAEVLLEMLSPYKEKLFAIGDSRCRSGFSTMYPRIRNRWELIKLSKKEKEDDNSSKRPKKASK